MGIGLLVELPRQILRHIGIEFEFVCILSHQKVERSALVEASKRFSFRNQSSGDFDNSIVDMALEFRSGLIGA
ncbi:hypothetical protein AS590_26075 [Prescottella equi]|nr:hypothetical protein AS590_26075 [Prescottella equi]